MFTAYKDAHVVVTGGANGIGKALALGFAKRGANVAVVDIHGDEAKAVAAEITAMGCKSIAIQADVSVLDECAKVYDTVMDAFGRCDVLVNDAGVSACPMWSTFRKRTCAGCLRPTFTPTGS